MKLIIHYMKRYKGLVLLNILSIFAFALVELGIPTLISDMIDQGVMVNDRQQLFATAIVVAVIACIGTAGSILLVFCCARISTYVTRDIRNDVFRKVQTFSHEQMNQFGVSSLITRTGNDAYQIMIFLNTILRTALLTPVMFAVSFSLVVRSSVRLSMVIVATIPVIVLGVIFVGKITQPLSENQQNSLDRINRIFRENLTGVRVIRSFNNDAYESQRFDKENRYYTKQSSTLFKIMSMTEPLFYFVMNLAALAIYYFAAGMIDADTLQVGKLVAFMEYLFHAMLSVMLFCTVFMMYPRASVSAKRIREVFESENSIREETAPKTVDTVESIEFDHVSFAYPDGEEPVLSDISFTVKKGETIAFIGSTGSGKSTLISLVPRFYDVCAGSIKINGIDLRKLSLENLRNHIGYVSQKAFLFHGTIADTIRFGKKDASMQEITQAAKTAQALDFIEDKPEGFDETVSESATNLSGGQKQRLSIARALVRHPQIMIYDDSFSALDFATDARLRAELKKDTGNTIVMIVAQRVSTIMDADHILVLNEGKAVGYGRHKDLLKDCEIYREIALSQLSKEELEYEIG